MSGYLLGWTILLVLATASLWWRFKNPSVADEPVAVSPDAEARQ